MHGTWLECLPDAVGLVPVWKGLLEAESAGLCGTLLDSAGLELASSVAIWSSTRRRWWQAASRRGVAVAASMAVAVFYMGERMGAESQMGC